MSVHGDDEPQANVERFEAAIVSGLSRSDVSIVDANTVIASNPPDPCTDSACVRHLAAAVSATHVLSLNLEVHERDYAIEMTLYDRQGNDVVRSRQSCDICGVEEVAQLLEDQAAAVRDKVFTLERPGKLLVASEPRGAEVLIDGQVVGTTPLEVELAPGSHELTLRKSGFTDRTRVFETVEGVEDHFAFELPPQARRAPQRALTGGGWAAVAVGGSLTVAGATLIGLNHQPVQHRCTGADVDDTGLCRWRYDSLPYGIPMVAVGAASVAAGAALLIVARRRRGGSKNRAHVRPSVGGVSIEF